MWSNRPHLLLEHIYHYLSWNDRLHCALVCQNWCDAFYSPWLWRRLVVTKKTFTRPSKSFHAYQATREEVNQRYVQLYLDKIGSYIQHITVLPNNEYYNVHGFIRVLFAFLEFFEEYPMPLLDSFKFTFACENQTPMGYMISGTGGNILESFKRLMHDFKGIKKVTLNDLLLNTQDAHGVIEHLQVYNQESLRYLELTNFTATRYPLFAVALFHNIHTVALSPHNLTNDVATLLAENTSVERLIIVQNQYTPVDLEPVSLPTWWNIKDMKPQLKVRLLLRGNTQTDVDLLIQDNAPVDEIIYNTPFSLIKTDFVVQVMEEYRITLKMFATYRCPRRHGQRSFKHRADSSLLLLIRECPTLETLVVRERISTATLLLLATEGKSLKKLVVRRNAIILKADWPWSPEWSKEFYLWLKTTARSYERTEKEVSVILGKEWKMLSDREFTRLGEKECSLSP